MIQIKSTVPSVGGETEQMGFFRELLFFIVTNIAPYFNIFLSFGSHWD